MKEFFEWGKRILGVGQPQPGQPQADEEQSRASGGTAQPGTEKGQTTGSSEPNSQQAGHEKNPARRKGSETTKRWNPEQGCLEVKTERVLELRSLSTVMIKLAKGEVLVLETDEVQQPKLTITERVYAGSKSEATRFYKENGSGVNVEVDSDTLSVTEKSSSGVVSGGSGSVKMEGRSGSVVVVNSDIKGNIVNKGRGGIVIVNGQQTGSSQPVAGRETRVVLRVPVANEGEKSEHSYNSYIIKVNSGNIKVENGTGKYTISADAGDIVVEACNMVDSKIENKAGKTKVAAATLNVSEIKSESGDIEVIGAKLNSCSIAGKTGKIAVTGGALDLSPITNESGYIEVIGATLNSCAITNEAGNIAVVGTTLNSCAVINESGEIEVTDGIFISENTGENTGENTVRTESGNILVGFGEDQGEIEVQTILGGRVIKETIYFEGVENPNGQTAKLSLFTQDGEIKVISK